MRNIIQKLIILGIALLTAISTRAQVAIPISDENNSIYDVGEIPVQYALTPSGAVTYQVAMDIHPDAENFQPQLSFSYNNQQRESALGYGWNIGGLSAINHVSGNIYYDNRVTPLSLSEDKLMLDGVRLIKKDADTWQTEQGLIKVKKLVNGTLEARYPDGNKAIFATSSNAPFSYVMTLCTNRKGRTIKYVYTQTDNLPYISKVMYGESEEVYNDSIVFTYKNINNDIARYIDGKSFKHSRLLEKVESFYKGKLWRRYSFTYEDRGVYQLMQLHCGTEHKQLNPLKFDYGSGRSIDYFREQIVSLGRFFNNFSSGEEGYKSLVLSRGKFNIGSGSDGLISYPQLSTYKDLGDEMGSDYSPDQSLLVYKALSGGFVTPVVFTAGDGFQCLAAADIQGSGQDQLVKVNYYMAQKSFFNYQEKIVVAVYPNASDPNRHSDYVYDSQSGLKKSFRQREFLFGDFNGDGKTELLAISSCRSHTDRNNKIASHALMINLQNRTTMFDGACFDYTFFQIDPLDTSPDRLIAMDYNSDGKTDICLINKDGTYVYEFTGSGFRQLAFATAASGISSNSFNGNEQELLVADMNGDGNMDLILPPKYVRCKEGYKHMEDGFCHGACEKESYLVSTSASGYKRYVHPYSGQKCLVDPSVTQRDVIIYDYKVDNGRQWKFLLSTGNSTYSDSNRGFKIQIENLFYGFRETAGLNFMLVDVDSDGLPDLLRNVRGKVELHLNVNGKISLIPDQRSTQTLRNLTAQFAIANVAQSYYWSGGLICVDNEQLHVYDYTHKAMEDRMLHDITDSYGVTTNHYYSDIMVANANRYVNDPYAIDYIGYPYSVLSPHYYVPAWAKKMKGNDVVSWEYYKYTNAVFHRKGLGFRGFQQIETEDFINRRKSVSTYDINLLGAEIKKGMQTDTITRDYELEIASDKIASLKLKKETMRNVLNGSQTTKEYEYGSYGQVIRSLLYKGGLNNTEETSYTYANVDNDDTYLLGLPVSTLVKGYRNDSIITQETIVDYDSWHLPICKTASVNGSISSCERLEYNDRRQLIKQEKRSYESPDWLSKTYAYTPEGRLLQETNAMGHCTSYSYAPETGLLHSTSDHKERITYYEHDEWGNLQKTIYPDGRVKQTSMAWSAGDAPGLCLITRTETGRPTTKTYYDQLGREIRSSQVRFDGRELKSDKVYHAKTGLLERESQPTTDSIPSRWNSYVYDRFNRLTSTRYASGKIDSCAYGVSTDTIIENGISHIRNYDESGKLIRVTDAGGSIEYYYRPDGQPIVTVAPSGVQTRFYYDNYGRRTAIKDPSAGIRRTEYDLSGNVCKEIDANGREISKEYDRYGRVVKQVTPELTTVYTHDDTENRVLSAVSDNGTSIRYAYDELGRLQTSHEECLGGKWLEKAYHYAANGIPSSIVYSSDKGALTTEKLTYTRGYLTSVGLLDADHTIIYRHDEENALGQLTKLTTGSMHRTYAFNEWGLPTGRTISHADGSTVFNHSYHFNVENNNLESRTDESRGLREAFGYDDLNRLSTYGDLQVIYDSGGNILSKDDAGALAYTNPNRPYAVTGLTPVANGSISTGLDITYTAGERPSFITQGTKRMALTYNSNHDRVRMQLSDADKLLLTRYSLGDNYEQDIDSTGICEKLYVGGNYYTAPAVLLKQGGESAVYYIHRDYLGSILQIVDSQGNVVEENSFDAWGCRRNPTTHTVYASGTAPKLMLGRGYTGHEHLDMFGLINMNARLYDPVLGRFLSADPYVQSPDFTQAFNRYSYCMNSPLCYVDENGELWWIAAAAVVGGLINVGTHLDNIDNFGQALGYFGVGAVGGALGAVTGGAVLAASGVAGGVVGGAIAGTIGGATSGFILGGGNTLMAGGSFGDAYLNAMTGMFTGAVTGAVIGGIGGGALSYFKGENVWNGSAIAQGRNAFSLKNTPIDAIEHPNTISFDNIPDVALLDNPTPASMPEPMIPNSPLDPSLNPALNQTPEGFTRFVTTPEGVTHDLLPTINRIQSGKIYPQFRHDGTIFRNDQLRLPSLPKNSYMEFVHPTPGLSVRPGAMRVVVGNDGAWWFTPDHYLSFIRIKF